MTAQNRTANDLTGRQPVRVLLIDDDALVRAGLRMILGADSTIEVVGEASDGADAVTAVAATQPHVVLMDIRMPQMDGITATAALRALPSPPQVIVLTTFGLDSYVLDALRAGASGFLLKDTPPREIVAAVHTVAAGEATLSPAVTRTLIERFVDGGADDRRALALARLQRLSGREQEVAVEVGRGQSNAEVAGRLYMSEATVKAHLSKILAKLDATNRVQVAIVVHEAGLV
jgi:DNA-binding NarL/FixJ family response regulator